MSKLKNLLFISMLLFAVSFGAVVAPPPVHAQDTVFYAPVGSGDAYSVTVNFQKDSTQKTVTDWFPFTELQQKNLYYTHKFTNTSYGYSVNNDTIRCILQVKDNNNLIVDSDTIGTGSAGSEIMISSGTATQYSVTPKKFGVEARLVYENVVTGTHKNGWGTELGDLTGVPTHLK